MPSRRQKWPGSGNEGELAGQYPRVRELADALFDCDAFDDYHRFGIDTFVAGVRALQPALTESGS